MKKKMENAVKPGFLYEQVMINIKEMIKSGQFNPNEKLPNENELCEIFETSRITIRRALKELENEGVIEILHGKGTFVKNTKQQIHMLDLNGFTNGKWLGKTTITKKTLSKTVEEADEQLMKLFQRDEPFEVLKLVRLIKDANSAFSVDYSYFPLDLYPGIQDKMEENVSTFQIVKNEYGVQFKCAKKELEFLHPSQEISELLEVSRMEPVIQIGKVIIDVNNIPVHYSLYYLLASKVKFNIDVDMQDDSNQEF
ncbi:GntR family transcriptional regulator [Sutcliffiella sp. NC1]|uniref:GntR family transcriptional regulator n=1 Tax=Sutcliffiella sp. NC1 TaxID=3004096 RepID=UPI0022DE6D1E|nr:GntR family transcriptional regulator [Sutcliffiella sp. NC1]WBL16916.1 GntR family transcriptional regulator [Sutcliffiella sp. NC1]